MSDSIKSPNENQAKPVCTPFAPSPLTNGVQMPLPRTFNGEKYYGADDVAKIIGVTRQTVSYWQQRGYFTADERAHDGRYLYLVERVMQLKSVYRPDWNQPAYIQHVEKPTPVAETISRAQLNLGNLPDSDRRGISFESFRRLGIGFDSKWRHSKSPNSIPTPRFIIPLGDGSVPAYNAVLTPTGRKDFKNAERWETQKCLTDGNKFLFNPVALKPDEFVFVTEGEIDAASILHATHFTVNACALGSAGTFGDLKKRLADISTPPKIIVLFDKDSGSETGQNYAPKLVAELGAIHVPAVTAFFEDVLDDDDIKAFGGKIDANEILQRAGDETLATLIQDIIDKVTPEFARIAREGFGTFTDISPEIYHSKKSLPKDLSPDIQDLIDRVNESLTKDNVTIFVDKARKSGLICPWCGSGSGDKGTGALAFHPTPSPHVACHKCHEGADALKLFAFKNSMSTSGKEFFDTLRAAADFFAVPYDTKIFESMKKNPHVTGNKTIDNWQKINGVINPELLAELKTVAKQINEIEHITAANANEVSIQRYLGAFRYYSPFASVDEKFFARLRDSKKAAKAKISAWDKDNSLPEPTDADKALAALDIININRKVEACLTQAKRAHRKYIAFSRRKEVADKKDAEHDEYIQNQPTTKDQVTDCPIELILPEGVIFNDEGIKMIDMDKPDGKDDRPLISVCQNLVVPTKIFREPSNHVTQYEVAIRTGKMWRRKIFDGRTLQDTRAVSELGNYGAHISDPRMMAKFFAKIIALNENNGRLEEIRAFSQPGWHDDNFSEFAYPTGGNDYVVLRTGFNFKQEFATRGDAETWKTTFADAMKHGGAIARIFVGTALDAPLIRPLHISNAQIHLHGDINNGKTALELLAASIFGDPGKLFRTFEATPKNRLAVAAAYNDLPTFLDEMETRPTKEMEKALPQSVYSYFTGKANQANKRDGSPRDPFYFSGARLSTGERAMLSDNDQTGAYKRIVQIRCHKLFAPKYAASLYPFTGNHFGHFGRPWTICITEHQATIRETFQSLVPQFTVIGNHEDTQVNSVVAAAVAYQYFQICIGAQNSFDTAFAVNDICEILDALPTMAEISGSERLIRALRSFVDGHPKNFVMEMPSEYVQGALHDVEAASFAETYGKIFHNGEVAFYPTALKKIIEKELGFASAIAHIETWNEEGKLISTGARPNQHAVLVCGKKRFTIHFRAGILSDPLTDNVINDDSAPPPQI